MSRIRFAPLATTWREGGTWKSLVAHRRAGMWSSAQDPPGPIWKTADQIAADDRVPGAPDRLHHYPAGYTFYVSESIADELRKAEFTYLAVVAGGGEESRTASFAERLMVVEDPPDPVTRKVTPGRIRTPAEIELQRQLDALTEARDRDAERIEALEAKVKAKATR